MKLATNKNAIKRTSGDKIYDNITILISVLLIVIFAYPLYFIIIASLSDTSAVWNGQVKILPVGFSLEGYQEIMKNTHIWMGYLNSIFYTGFGVLVNLFFTLLMAYVLSCPEFMPRNVVMKLITFTMFFGGGLIPTYLLIKNLAMLDTVWSIVLPGAINVQNLIITRTFFQSNITGELKEAAFLDGSSHTGFLLKIGLPLSKAIIAVMALYYGVAHWNSYFSAMIYLSDENKFPLQLILREILLKTTAMNDSGGDPELVAQQIRLADSIKYCAIIVASVPALVAYPFVQKFFVKGVMIGSIKG
ncbi:MAG: carbohydrate ABC transporter permease [Clostridia bacterium]|nr:carbohydrate ABC transporter permease [Clostridia bacterium]